MTDVIKILPLRGDGARWESLLQDDLKRYVIILVFWLIAVFYEDTYMKEDILKHLLKQSIKPSYYFDLHLLQHTLNPIEPINDLKFLEKIVYDKNINLKYTMAYHYENPLHKNMSIALPTDEDIDAIRNFFRDTDRVVAQLKKLNGHLKKLAQEREIYDENAKTLVGFRANLPFKENKLLSGYFKTWARENGFSSVQKMDGFLKTKQFMAVLKGNNLFKDKAQGGKEHGEWTHLIQLWCLVEANKERSFLKRTSSELLQWLGEQDPSVWFDLFELPISPKTNGSPFTNVFDFNKYLLSGKCAKEAPILHMLILGRANKRTIKIGNFSFFKSDSFEKIPDRDVSINESVGMLRL